MTGITRPDHHRRAQSRRRPREDVVPVALQRHKSVMIHEVALSVTDTLEGEWRFGRGEGGSAESHHEEESEGEQRECMGGPPEHCEWGESALLRLPH